MEHSIITKIFTGVIEFGNKWLTLGSALFRSRKNIFLKIELMMLVSIAVCIGILMTIHQYSFEIGLVVSILLVQRVLEYLIVYSRNFILNRGRIFSHFPDERVRGQWLILMFFLNLLQAIIVFAIWYRFLSVNTVGVFTQSLSIIDSFYASVMIFFTVGYGDIMPVAFWAKLLMIFEAMVSFYTLVIVINGLHMLVFQQAEPQRGLNK